jgi:hypothetical protein
MLRFSRGVVMQVIVQVQRGGELVGLRCCRGGAEVQQRCKGVVEVQRCRAIAELLQRCCRRGGAAKVLQKVQVVQEAQEEMGLAG